jgi:hypothetical protein
MVLGPTPEPMLKDAMEALHRLGEEQPYMVEGRTIFQLHKAEGLGHENPWVPRRKIVVHAETLEATDALAEKIAELLNEPLV